MLQNGSADYNHYYLKHFKCRGCDAIAPLLRQYLNVYQGSGMEFRAPVSSVWPNELMFDPGL